MTWTTASRSGATASMPADDLFEVLAAAGAERCFLYRDDASGLRAVLMIDDVILGPAAGGIRTMRYPTLAAAVRDAARLARAMTYKNALAGLDAGGGKMVVIQHADLDRPAAFARLGQFVQELGGLFRTAGDVGTGGDDLAHMARTCDYVHADEERLADAVARGVLRCIEACAAERGKPAGASGLRVAVQGCGAIGSAVARWLVEAGAQLVVADAVAERATTLAEQVGAEVIDPGDVLTADVDVLAPCALGGVITEDSVGQLRCWAVCGAANNTVADAAAADALRARGVLYVPDVVSSAGAVIAGIGKTVMNLADITPLIDALGDTAKTLLEQSAASGRNTEDLAIELAQQRIGAST